MQLHVKGVRTCNRLFGTEFCQESTVTQRYHVVEKFPNFEQFTGRALRNDLLNEVHCRNRSLDRVDLTQVKTSTRSALRLYVAVMRHAVLLEASTPCEL